MIYIYILQPAIWAGIRWKVGLRPTSARKIETYLLDDY